MRITLYNQPNFGGTSQQLPVGRHDVDVLMQTGGIGNDQLGSLRVPDGLLVKLFRHKEYAEPLSTYRTDVPNVTNEDTSTSSLVVELLPGNYYYLKAEHSSSVLDVSFASKEEEAKLIQHRRHSGENQQFEFTPLEDGSYTISNRWSQKVLSVKGSSSEPQAGIVQQTWAGQDHQRWMLVGQPGGSYKFVNKLSGKTIDIQGGSTNDSAAAIQNTDADSRSQRFFIEPVAVKPKPVNLMITSPSPICWAELADLSAPAITAGSDVGDLTYFLDEAAQQPVVTPNAVGSGTCYIRLTTPDGRAVVKPVEILVRDKPGLTVVPPAPCCADKTVNLVTTVTSPIGPTDKLEFFQDKAFTQFLSDPTRIGQSGTYYIRLTDEHGCSVSASVEVVVKPLPKLEVLASEWAYRGETVDLTAPHITKGSESGTLACFGPNDPQVPLTPEQATSVGAGTYYLQLTGTNGFKSALTAISVTLEERPSLAVPIHADGQYIQEKTPCAAPRIDFSRLPYYDGTCDINPYTPYVGEELEAVPFTDGAFALQPGVHLHWALPDFLTRSFRYPLLQLEALRRATRTNWLGEPQPNGELFDQLYTYFREKGWVKEISGNAVYASILADKEAIDVAISEGLGSTDPDKQPLAHEILRVRSLLEPGGTQMPPVPNRWRVVRVGGDGPAKTWVVESDFLRESSLGDHQTGVSFPDYTPRLTPFGWLGRRYEGSVAPEPQGGAYLAMPLTTLGYGDPTFAAFYPNCHSVFGLHDETAEPGKTYTYDIVGYYEPKNPTTGPQNADIEFFELLRKDLTNRTHPDELRPALSTFLREHLQLPMADPRPGVWPDRLVCCGRLTLTANPADAENPSVIVTVGNTSTEAVSAYLADRLSKSKKIEVEEYLEALQYLSRLDHLQTDIGPKLREERHRQGFSSEKGGTQWVFAPRQATGGQAEQAVEQTTLTDNKAHFLHLLNEFQLAFDRTDEQVKALRQQIFADWTKYMLCQYPPDGADDNYPDADEARFFIDYKLMPALDQLNEQRQQAAKALRDHVAGFWHFRVGDVRAPAGLYAGLVQLPDVAPYLSAAAGGSEAALVQCLNMYIDQQGYHDPMAQRADGVHTWTLEEILERQHYETHLRTNRLRLENGFPNNLAQHPDLVLLRKPHSPFHRPTDPVVMLTGDALKTTRKHGQDGMLTNELWVLNGRNLLDEAARIAPQLIPEDWQRPPGRHPLLLDWLVEFFPVEDTDFNFDRYEPNYLLDKYELALNAVDLSATKTDLNATGPQLYTGVGQTFWGSCLLATGGSKSLRQSLETFLMGELGLTEADLTEPAKIRQTFFQNDSGKDAWLNSYQQDKGTAASPDTFDDFYSWEPSRWKPDGPPPAELAALWTTKHKALAVLAYEQLCQTDFLAQALGGFTPALLMLKEGVQLRVADPLGYPEYQAFSERVNEAVGLLNQASTLPNNPFFPIRAGAAKLLELRLLDTFGLDIVHLRDIQGVITAETLRPQHSAHHVELTPRLSQAARLNFHWLSATNNAVEQSEHPASSPICGWVLANLMDESLMIYAQTGAALGYVDREGHWRSAPGQRPAIMAEGIPNWHLRRMVLWLIAKAKEARLPTDGKSDTIPHFIEQLSQALIRVEPPRSDHAGEGVAMLMSRPLALVRATVSLELKGAPAVNQSWAQFRQVIESPEQDRESTLDLERVALPLRIGEDHQLNDGLVGFWVDADDGYAYRDDAFRMPSLHRATSGTRDYTDDHLLDTMTLGADGNRGRAMTLNLLMDPHGSVHATCGILPVNELSLPPDLYAKALEQLEITFLTAPLLTPQQMIHLSLPPEPGFQWAWVDTDRQRWREVSTVGHFRRDELVAAFGGAGTLLWDQLIERGWVTLEGEQAVIVPPGRRPATDDFPPTQLAPLLNHFLATRQINPFQMVPGGNSWQELREGWLRLRPLPDSPLFPETDQPTPA